uniref:G_PROTEIN_RECEP_F1_2 domain-containing protein n=1 Tax=Steinernema glaseri TaxID=37863 RepID=A0A1I7ZY96_9BILA
MDEEFSYYYSIMLFVTSVGSIAVKPLCIYIVIMKTPVLMRTVSYFILNELLWNFSGNLLFTLGKPILLVPALCFRMDGVVSDMLKTEQQRSIYSIVIVVCVANFCLGFLSTFVYRYVTLAFSSAVLGLHKIWGYMLCVIAHFIVSLLVACLLYNWHMPVSEYPKEDLPENTQNIVCYRSGEREIMIVTVLFCSAYGLALFLFVLLVVLSISALRKRAKLMNKKTHSVQKEILRNLIIITGTAVILGCVPFTAVVLFFMCHINVALQRTVTSCATLFTLNFGTVYAVLILSLFKTYRKAVLGLLRRSLAVSTVCCPNNVISPALNV